MRKLVPVLLFAAAASALAEGAEGPSSWLGNRIDPAQTAFCRAHGCVLQRVRKNDDTTMGWHDGTLRTYLVEGFRLEVDIRPAGWVSNARLIGLPDPVNEVSFSLQGYRFAADFLSAVTGRHFSPAAIAACEKAGRASSADADVYGLRQPLSRWNTPGGLPFVARCGVGSQLGVWAGWMQQ